MARQNWNILANTFEFRTRGSFRKAFGFADRHYKALKSTSTDAGIAVVYNSFKPVYEDFEKEYVKWLGLLGTQEGATTDFKQTMLNMRVKLKEWESKIYFHYPEDSPEAVTIFPHKRTPFYKGSNVSRTEAVHTLIKQLGKYAPLATVKADVETYYELLSGKLLQQSGNNGAIGTQSNLLEEKRKVMVTEMYGNLGLLMHHFRHNTALVKDYFDMGLLKNRVHRKTKKKK